MHDSDDSRGKQVLAGLLQTSLRLFTRERDVIEIAA
jgi:hypothetical protein